jgi:sec-independent protein translocase protein TatA
MDGLEGWHIVIIVGIAVVLFGSGKLPGAARSIGQSLRIFKSEMKAAVKDEEPGAATVPAVAPPVVQTAIITDVPPQAVPQPVVQPGVQPVVQTAAQPVVQTVPQPAPQNVSSPQ